MLRVFRGYPVFNASHSQWQTKKDTKAKQDIPRAVDFDLKVAADFNACPMAVPRLIVLVICSCLPMGDA